MILAAYHGELNQVSTEKGEILIMNLEAGETYEAKITPETKIVKSSGWEDLIGEDVKAIVIDGRVRDIRIDHGILGPKE